MLAAALRWRNRALIAIPLAVLWIFSTPIVSDVLMRSLEDRYTWRRDAAYPDADAVFVLGGGILGARDHGGANMEWGSTAGRFDRALSLFSSGHATILVLSAGGAGDRRDVGEGARLQEIALQRGVPSQSVILTPATPNTAAEADALTELAMRLHWKRVLLVTSAFHMPRAMGLFLKCPVEVIPVPVNYQTRAAGQSSDSASLDQVLPHAEALFRSERTLREYMGILFYSVVRH